MTDNPDIQGGENSQTVAAAELRQLIERVERVESDMADLRDDRKEIYAEAKGRGYSVKAIRKLVAARKDSEKAQEEHAMVALYANALGMDIFG